MLVNVSFGMGHRGRSYRGKNIRTWKPIVWLVIKKSLKIT